MKIIVQFSGGKDSQAALIWAVNTYGKDKVIAQYSDTVWENEITYNHIQKVIQQLGVQFIVLKSKEYTGGMIDLAREKYRFPASKSKYCTTELKVKPFINWLMDEVKDHVMIIQGIRKDESDARSEMNEQCRYFKYYFQPYTNNYIKLQRIEKIKQKNKGILPISKQDEYKKLVEKLILGEIENKFHDYRKEEVKKWVKKYDDTIIRPFFNATSKEVIDYIYANGQEPNPLYKMGSKRVGCYPCIHSGIDEIRQIQNRFPERIEEIAQIEIDLGTTFFTTGKIPAYACANGQYPTIKEVAAYSIRHQHLDLFQEEPTSCMSYYNQCE